MDKKTVKEKLKNLKHKEVIFAVLVVLVMLIIYFSSQTQSDTSALTPTRSDYCADMQTQITSAVAKLSGDKDARVIVNWESSIESVIAYGENVTQTGSSSTPMIVQSSGSGSPVVLKTLNPKAQGIAVIVKSADTKQRLDIMNMVSTLLGISPEKVAVYSKN